MPRNIIDNTLFQLVSEEMAFLTSEIVARAVRGEGIEIMIDGARSVMRVVPPDFEGVGVFRPLSRNVALLIHKSDTIEQECHPH